MKRNGTAIWSGPGKTGKGTVSVQSGLFKDAQYSFGSRFEEGVGTNPEELVAAAHASCYSMKLSFILGKAGFEPNRIETLCVVTLEDGAITKSHLKVSANVPGISEDVFKASVEEAKTTCPISKSLTAELSVESTLAK